MPKYNTDLETSTVYLDGDVREVVARWSTKPFQGHRHRHNVVEQRLVVEYHANVGFDVRWEVRSDDTRKVPDEWGLVESYEFRDGRCRRDRHNRRRWLA